MRRRRHDGRALARLLSIGLGLSLGLADLASADPAIPPDICDGRLAELPHGTIVFKHLEPVDGDGVAFEACALTDAPAETLWPVLKDCEYFDEFLPRAKASRLQRRIGNVAHCDLTIDLPFPLRDLRMVTRATEGATPDGGYERSWELIDGDFKRNQGAWSLIPWPDDPSKTLLRYHVDAAPKTIVPNFIIRLMQSTTAIDVFDAIRKRVAACGTTARCGPPQRMISAP